MYLANPYIDPTETKQVDLYLNKLSNNEHQEIQELLDIYSTDPKNDQEPSSYRNETPEFIKLKEKHKKHAGYCREDFGHQLELIRPNGQLKEIFSGTGSGRSTPNLIMRVHDILLKVARRRTRLYKENNDLKAITPNM